MGFLKRFFAKRVNRNQWQADSNASIETYRKQMCWTWAETEAQAPEYFARLAFAVSHARGHVLEIGCGIGNMTRWLANSLQVKSVLAVDAFPEAIAELNGHGLPKTTALCSAVEALQLDPSLRFDTVMLCEVLEHLYADEEKAFLRAIQPCIGPSTRYVVSTPIGFMPDPHHVRGVSKKAFLKHLKRYYGNPVEVNYESGYSQSAYGFLRQ